MGLKPPRELVDYLREDLARLRAAKAAQPDPKMRRKAYRDYLKACDAIVAFAASPISPYRTDRSRALQPLAELISVTGYGQLLGVTSGWRIDRLPHEGLVREERGERDNDRSEYVRTLDMLTLPRRQSIAVEAGPELVQKLIGRLTAPVQRLLEIEGRGGRPVDAERRHVIRVAALNFRHLANKKPTKDEGGDFVLFCQNLCVELGLATDTLGSLVADVLRPRVRRRTKTPK